MRSIIALLLCLAAWPAIAQTCVNEAPWIVYGQTTTIPNNTVRNPVAGALGLRGESSLPFTVPAGRELRITTYGGEAYNTGSAQGIVYAPYIGSTPPTGNQVLHSVYASERSNETLGVNFIARAGQVVNLQIQSSYTLNFVVGWYMRGTLCDAP